MSLSESNLPIAPGQGRRFSAKALPLPARHPVMADLRGKKFLDRPAIHQCTGQRGKAFSHSFPPARRLPNYGGEIPAARQCGAISLVTTLPAPIIAPSPTWHALEDDRAHAYPGIIANHDAPVALAAGSSARFSGGQGAWNRGSTITHSWGQQNAPCQCGLWLQRCY